MAHSSPKSILISSGHQVVFSQILKFDSAMCGPAGASAAVMPVQHSPVTGNSRAMCTTVLAST